jgi:hypothetical protein
MISHDACQGAAVLITSCLAEDYGQLRVFEYLGGIMRIALEYIEDYLGKGWAETCCTGRIGVNANRIKTLCGTH